MTSHASVSRCGHDGWVAGCSTCAENERIALVAMGETGSACAQCGDSLSMRDHVYDILGVGNHIDCLEAAGLWNQNPEGDL